MSEKLLINSEEPTATKQIYDFIREYLNRPKDTHVNRASAASMCYLRRWFQRSGYDGEALTPRKQVNFLLGDLTERVVQYFIERALVGDGKLYSEVSFGEHLGSITFQGKEIKIYKQQDLTADINGIEVTAHVDGWGKRNVDGEWELIEIKSAADFGFEDFKREGPGSYIKQAHVNLSTFKAKELGAKSVRFFYLKKNTGHLWDQLHEFNEETMREVANDYKLANQEEKPVAPYGFVDELFRGKPTGKTTVVWYCQYCPYIAECKKEKKMTIEFKSGKPKYYFT